MMREPTLSRMKNVIACIARGGEVIYDNVFDWEKQFNQLPRGLVVVKVGIYCRVSDDKLKSDGDRRQDINRQSEALVKYAQAMGWEVNPERDVYRDDGKSAFKEDYQSRPAFVQLLREIRGHHYQRVLVEDLTRWSRRLEDGLKTLKEASAASCTVTSTKEGEADITTANGWMKSALCLMFAEWSSRIMSEKVKSGMARIPPCVVCGLQHRGRIPFACKSRGRSKAQSVNASKNEGVSGASPSKKGENHE